MELITSKIDKVGRLLLPSRFRKKLGIRPGTEVLVSLDESYIHVQPKSQARRNAQEFVCRLIPKQISIVDELIFERRKAARRGN